MTNEKIILSTEQNEEDKCIFADTNDLEHIHLFSEKSLFLNGLVTTVREGQTKKGNPYAILKIVDCVGSYEIPLFGEDYIKYSKFARTGLSLYIKGRVRPKEWKPTEFELKILSISLSCVKGDLEKCISEKKRKYDKLNIIQSR